MVTEDAKEWKFTCDQCSYVALYFIDRPYRRATTSQVIDPGDPSVIHLDNKYRCDKKAARFRKKQKKKSKLPTHLRKQIDDIIDKSEKK